MKCASKIIGLTLPTIESVYRQYHTRHKRKLKNIVRDATHPANHLLTSTAPVSVRQTLQKLAFKLFYCMLIYLQHLINKLYDLNNTQPWFVQHVSYVWYIFIYLHRPSRSAYGRLPVYCPRQCQCIVKPLIVNTPD